MHADFRRFLAALVAVAMLVPAAPMVAGTPKDQAMSLAKAAVVLLEQGRLDAALGLFEQAYALDPAPVLLGHMAKVWDRKGDLGKARDLYGQWAAAETDPDRQAKARARLDEVLDRMPGTLVVTATPAGATVTVDGQPVPAGKAVELKRGTHEVAATLKGHAPANRTVEVQAGGETRVAMVLDPLPGRIEVLCSQPGARVAVDGKDPRDLPLQAPFEVAPGRHEVRVTSATARTWIRTVEVGPGQTVRVNAEMVALAPPVARPIPAQNLAAPAKTGISPWPWVGIGTGAAALVVGGVMSGLAYQQRGQVSNATRDQDPAGGDDLVTGMTMKDAQSHVDQAKSYDIASYAMYGVGGAAVLTGVILWAVQSKAKARAATAPRESPAVGLAPLPGGAAVAVSGGF